MEASVASVIAGDGRFTLGKSGDGHYLTLTIRRRSAGTHDDWPSRKQASIVSSGVEAFLLQLDDTYAYQLFDWDPVGQQEAVQTLARIALEYLSGGGRIRTRRNLLARRVREFALTLPDGETHYLAARRSNRSNLA